MARPCTTIMLLGNRWEVHRVTGRGVHGELGRPSCGEEIPVNCTPARERGRCAHGLSTYSNGQFGPAADCCPSGKRSDGPRNFPGS